MSALIASLFAVGTAPAAAAPIDERGLAEVSAFSGKTACLGPALDGAGFSDVSMDNAHYNAINCIVHYGITAGIGDGSFGASDSVTRGQMALFLSGMATLAGVTLDDAMDAGFTDLGDTDDNWVNAINRMVNGGVMTGTSDDTFSPGAAVTRAEMALWLANFMVVATSNDTALNVTKDREGIYTITRPAPTSTSAVIRTDDLIDDHFVDARLSQARHIDSAISAVYELGIAAGYGDDEFKGHRLVSRQEMATFITRTLGHTNVRPVGLTAQLNLGSEGGIQVSMRTADFAPVANEPIDLFRSYFPSSAFKADGSCELRYVTPVDTPRHTTGDACEIDRNDTVTDDDGNQDYTATALTDSGEGSRVMCGTGFDIAAATEADAVYWVWTGVLGDTVDADTELIRVEGVAPPSQMPLAAPHHAGVTGGLDSDMNQHEAQMGDTVTFTLQLHGTHAANAMHPPAAPDATGNKYNLVIQVNKLISAASDGVWVDEAVLPGAESPANSRSAVEVDEPTTYALATPIISRTPPRVVSPDSSGMITIPVTYADPDPARNSDDVVVTVELTAYQPVGTPTPADYNTITDFHAGGLNRNDAATGSIESSPGVDDPAYSLGFSTRVIFSDDAPRPQMFAISADAPVYRLAQGTQSPVRSYVDISALDQYGNPVRGLSVNAISNQVTAGTGLSVFPFVQYFTTRSDGSYRVTYNYSGGSVDEKLIAFASVPYNHDGDTATAAQLANRDPDAPADRDLEDPPFAGSFTGSTADTFVTGWDHFLPRNAETQDDGSTTFADTSPSADQSANQATVFWANIGRLVRSQGASDGTLGGYAFDPAADTGLLAVDVSNKAFVVDQLVAAAPGEGETHQAATAGNYVYYWDQHDTFEIGPAGNTLAVSMELFETIVSASGVTLGTLSWTSYNYNRPNDRAHWTLTCT